MIKSVFFDLDGTLLDTSKDLGNALNALLKDRGMAPLADHEIRAEVSNGANALIKLGFGELPPARQSEYRQQLLLHYKHHIAEATKPFEGITKLIETLTNHGISWGVVTNKPADYTLALLPHFDFASRPIAVICPENVHKAKPHPEGLLMACQIAGCAPKNAIYVGDHLRDIEAGINANMLTIAVGYGFTSSPNDHLDWRADHTVGHASEIWPIINQLNHS